MERKDQWTTEEDRLLADTVLNGIRNGGTQLQAFEQAGGELGRTASACGFRWNSVVRKTCEREIAEAKQEKRRMKAQRGQRDLEETPAAETARTESRQRAERPQERELPAGADAAEAFERELQMTVSRLEQGISQLIGELRRKDEQVRTLEQQIAELPPEARGDYDLRHLIEILNRARQLGAFEKIG